MEELKLSNLEELKELAFKVEPMTTIRYPQSNRQKFLSTPVDKSLENGYNVSNRIVAFISKGVLYVIPYMHKVIKVLIESDYTKKDFHVPFSNLDYPVGETQFYHWMQLADIAHKERIQDFIQDCYKFCDKHGFKEIDTELFEACFEIPTDGIRVKLGTNIGVYYPVIRSLDFDGNTEKQIGYYCSSSGNTIFTYRNGKTFVTSSARVLNALKKAGYKYGCLFVPFCNGEKVLDVEYLLRLQHLNIC